MKIINDAVDKVRRAEQEEQGRLCEHALSLASNPQTLSARQRKTLAGLPTRHLRPPMRIGSAWPSGPLSGAIWRQARVI